MIGENIANQAKLYIGTPFHHQGRSRHGLDCIGLVVRVLDDLGVILKGKSVHAYDNPCYSREPAAPYLTTPLSELFEKVTSVEVGDILLFNIQHAPRHVAIVTDIVDGIVYFTHAYEPYGAVRMDDDMGARWRKRLCAIYRVPYVKEIA